MSFVHKIIIHKKRNNKYEHITRKKMNESSGKRARSNITGRGMKIWLE